MQPNIRSLCASMLALAMWSATSAQTGTAKSVTEEFDHMAGGPERACLALAKAMPEDRYGFVPSNGEFKGVRSFGQLAQHIAVENYRSGAALLGEKSPVDPGAHDNGPDSIQTKAKVVRFLADSFTYLHRAMRTVDERNLMELVDYPGGRVTRLAVVVSALAHPWDVYGQMIEYLRMNGIDPQRLHD